MKDLFGFQGSIGRKKFIILFFATMIAYSLAALLITQREPILMLVRLLIMLVALFIYISILIRRLHDIGKTSKDILLLLIPIYGLYVFALLFFKKGIYKDVSSTSNN